MYKWQDWLLKRDFPFAVESETWEEWKGLQNTGEKWFLEAVALSMEEAVSKGYSYRNGSCFS